MLCDCCKKKEALFKDYRVVDGVTTKLFVCADCLTLDDLDFNKGLSGD